MTSLATVHALLCLLSLFFFLKTVAFSSRKACLLLDDNGHGKRRGNGGLLDASNRQPLAGQGGPGPICQ